MNENEETKIPAEIVESAKEAATKSAETQAEQGTNGEDENAKLLKILETPLTVDEAQKDLATNDVDRMKLLVVRQKWLTQRAQIELNLAALDEQLRMLDMDRAVIARRTLNGNADKK